MARLQLSKSSLSKEKARLRTCLQFLPSLDLKRQEQMAQRAKAVKALAECETELAQFSVGFAEAFPMLANHDVDLTDLVTVTDFELETENVMGAHLPKLARVEVKIRDYSDLATPTWVDGVAESMKAMLRLKLELQVHQKRVELLNVAVRKITQRVNLFDKVLIPRAKENIKRIRIYLSDNERAAVVNAKLAKSKRLKLRAAQQ